LAKSPLPRFQDGQAVRRLCLKWYAFCRQMKVLFQRARHITISTGNQGEDDSSAAHATARKKCAAHLSRTKNHLADNSAHSRPNENTFLPYDGPAAKSVGGFPPKNNDEINCRPPLLPEAAIPLPPAVSLQPSCKTQPIAFGRQ